MLKGSIYITYDVNLCLSNLNTCKTIIIADETDKYNIPGKIGGNLLSPPYQALVAIIDNDEEKFRYEYMNYLITDPTVNKFINIILKALIVGTNIIFLIDKDGPVKFDMVLKEYFMMTFGIILGDSHTQFQYDINQNFVILNKLYIEDDINPNEYLKLFPLEIPFDPFILRKLAFDLDYTFIDNYDNMNTQFKKMSKILKSGGIVRDVVKRIG